MTDKKIMLIPTAALALLMILEIIVAASGMTELLPYFMFAAGATEIIEIAAALVLFKKWSDEIENDSNDR